MKNSFQAYYRPSQEAFKELWKRCLFVPDTNMLLNIYRYSEATRKELIGILEKISPQLWIPYQVGLEYQRLRPGVILQQEKAYDDIKKILEEIQSSVEKRLNLSQSHPSINKVDILKQIKDFFISIQRELDKQKSKHPNLLENDTLRDKLAELFGGKVGDKFSSEKLDELYKMGEKRYKKRIPPGYMDEKKEGDEKYGDIVIWFQMIEKAKEFKKPIIFITDDDKEDWWFSAKEKRIGPRPELIEEMLKKTGETFYMYGVERFMEYSRIFLKRGVDQKAIKEVRNMRKQREDMVSEVGKALAIAKSFAIREQALKGILASSDVPTLTGMLASSDISTLADMLASHNFRRYRFGLTQLYRQRKR